MSSTEQPALVYGPRGSGKTQFTLGLATHLSTGQRYLGWEIPQPVGVLYIDGEMPLDELRKRAVLLSEHQSPPSLYFLSGEMVYTKLEQDLVLTREAMRHAVGAILDAHPDIRVVILDNISCLFSGISEDSKQDWEPFNAWLVGLTWTASPLEDSLKSQIQRLLDDGVSPTAIVKELSVDTSYVYRIKRGIFRS